MLQVLAQFEHARQLEEAQQPQHPVDAAGGAARLGVGRLQEEIEREGADEIDGEAAGEIVPRGERRVGDVVPAVKVAGAEVDGDVQKFKAP